MTAMIKHDMRILLRSRREGDEARRQQSYMICSHILNSQAYQHAAVIAGYVPMKHEADVMPVLDHALRAGKKLVLPRCGRPPEMTFRRIASLDDLVSGAYGIPEPSLDAEIIPLADADLVLVPLEGIDLQGYRLGKGGGYYDRALAGGQSMTMGCALSWQMVERIPRDPWDEPLKMCAMPNGIIQF